MSERRKILQVSDGVNSDKLASERASERVSLARSSFLKFPGGSTQIACEREAKILQVSDSVSLLSLSVQGGQHR